MKKILVVEDDTSVRENIVELLSAEGYAVLEAENGAEGVRLAWEGFPDLIICDILMPKMDGYGVLATLRRDKNAANIPIVFLTALSDRSDQRRGMSLGADDFISKPFTRDELLNSIRVRLERQETLARQAQQKLASLHDQVSMSMPHELLAPLSLIMGFSEVLVNDYSTLEREQILEVSRDIGYSAQRLLRMVQNYMLYAELEAIQADLNKTNLYRHLQVQQAGEVIIEVALMKADEANRKEDLTIAVKEVSLQISEIHLQKILEELLDNAFKFSLPGSPISVTGAVNEAGSAYILSITDQGRGINPELIAEIDDYTQFDRKIYERQGRGMGLVIVKRLIDLYSGSFSIFSQGDKGARVEVFLPVVS